MRIRQLLFVLVLLLGLSALGFEIYQRWTLRHACGSQDPRQDWCTDVAAMKRCLKASNWYPDKIETARQCGRAAIPGIIASFNQGGKIRESAEALLADLIKTDPKAIVPDLIVALQHPDPEHRHTAVLFLKWMEPHASDAIPALIHTLDDESLRIRGMAFRALTIMEPEETVPALIAALNHKQPQIRKESAKVLKYLGGQAKEAIPALVEALKDEDVSIHLNVASALGTIETDGKNGLPALITLLEHENPRISDIAAHDLWYIAIDRCREAKTPQQRSAAAQTALVINAALRKAGTVGFRGDPQLMQCI